MDLVTIAWAAPTATSTSSPSPAVRGRSGL
uniref:Cytochrome b6-f complex subunit 8 n=1 Tax=Bolbitis laxireticulata TaxID=2921086 RepID=A0A8T9EHL6_9MONI|nr:cytochrome b6/f complex subunit VIII [Bolbitis laxireticulata]UNA61860.1 cytochrome b6/f complex subunit VIII [Bolbitis laxireticulata]